MSRIIGDVEILWRRVVQWRVPDLDAPEMNETWSLSPEFDFGGKRWQLWIWPSAYGGSLSLSVKRDAPDPGHSRECAIFTRASPNPAQPAQFSFALRTADGQKVYERRGTKLFEEGIWHSIGELPSREEYGRRKSELCSYGSVRIVCAIDIITAEDLYKEFNNLKKKYEDSQLKLEETEKKNSDIKRELDAHKADKESLLNELKLMREKFGRNDKVLQDLKQVFQKQDHCDVVLRVKGREFQAHKVVLAARSPAFSSTFRNDTKEKVDIEDCDPSVFPDFLNFLYSGEVGSLSEKNVFGIFTVADIYDVTDLRTKCLEHMKENVSVDTFCESLTVALQHSETELLNICTDFFVMNAPAIFKTETWQAFLKENPTQSNELVIRYAKCIKQSR